MTKLLKSNNQIEENRFGKEPHCKVSMSKINPDYQIEEYMEKNHRETENHARRRKSTLIKSNRLMPGRKSTLSLLASPAAKSEFYAE